MRMNSLLSILIGSLSITSHAFPIGAGKSASSINCNQNGYEKSFSEMVQKVAIIGDMSIKSFDKSYAEYGITPEEARQIHDASGELKCAFPGEVTTFSSNAWLIGSNQEITVNLHSFKDQNDKPYSSLKGCRFISYAYPEQSFELDFDQTPADNFQNRLAMPYDVREDWAKIRLKKPVRINKALDPDYSDTNLNKNDNFLMISRRPPGLAAYESQSPNKLNQSRYQLTIQSCSTQKIYISNSKSTVLDMDCDTIKGMSGALMFMRRQDGALVPKAFFSAANEDIGNGKPWNPFTNSAGAVVFDKNFLSLYRPELNSGKSAAAPQTN